MANEIQVTAGLSISNGFSQYISKPTSFKADQEIVGGPTPGEILVSTSGTDASLVELTTPGVVRIQNLDPTNYVTWGAWDPSGSTFRPVGELLPGETYVFRLARDFRSEYGAGPGTSTTGTDVTLRFKANTAPCKVLVEAFEK